MTKSNDLKSLNNYKISKSLKAPGSSSQKEAGVRGLGGKKEPHWEIV